MSNSFSLFLVISTIVAIGQHERLDMLISKFAVLIVLEDNYEIMQP